MYNVDIIEQGSQCGQWALIGKLCGGNSRAASINLHLVATIRGWRLIDEIRSTSCEGQPNTSAPHIHAFLNQGFTDLHNKYFCCSYWTFTSISFWQTSVDSVEELLKMMTSLKHPQWEDLSLGSLQAVKPTNLYRLIPHPQGKSLG